MADFTVGKYLAKRFEQIGLKHYLMVPRRTWLPNSAA